MNIIEQTSPYQKIYMIMMEKLENLLRDEMDKKHKEK